MEERVTPAFARSWWALHQLEISDSGQIEPVKLVPDAPFDEEAERIDSVVDELLNVPAFLARLLNLLATCAPTELDVRFIGTSVLEDAYGAIGDSALEALEKSGLSETVKGQILSGFRP